uniref:J domain-containing protein required for chloroplast accumulation response 1 n=1 Tax=Kalanchoe fedtschenkoi TaxID=63787 RepID=A0A7N0V2F4_KALFE
MERFSNRESVLLGYSPMMSFAEDPGGSSSKSSSSFSDAVVDFHDVFGGPPRRVSIQERRYSLNSEGGGGADEGLGRRGSDEAAAGMVARRSPWSGLGFGEKPVFGEASGEGAPRRKTSDDFFDDIFRGDGSGESTPRRAERDYYSSSVPADGAFGLQSSIPAKLGKGMEVPVFTSVGRSPRRSRDNYSSSPTAQSSRLSRQGSQSQGDLTNEAQLFYRQSPLSVEFSFANDGSVKVTKNEKGDGEGIVKHSSTIGDSLLNSGQFHFSIYKWASKGAPPMIPIRGGVNFRLRDKSNGKSLNSDGKLEVNGELEQAAVNLAADGLAPVSDIELNSSKSLRAITEEKGNESTPAMKSEGVLNDDLNPIMEETKKVTSGVADPLISSKNIADADSDDCNYHEIRARNKSRTVSDLMVLGIQEDEDKENQKSGLTSAINENERQAESLTTTEVGGKPKGTTIFSRFANFGSYIKKQDGKGAASDSNSDVDKTSVPSSPGDSSRRKRVKEKVKEFVEMFNPDSFSKPKMDAETQSQSSERKDKGTTIKAEVGVTGSANKAGKDLSKPKLDKKFESASAALKMDKKIIPETMSSVLEKMKMSPKASTKMEKNIVPLKDQKVTPHSTDRELDRDIKPSAALTADKKKKETFGPAIIDKKITPPTKVTTDSPKAKKKFTPQKADTVTDTNLAVQAAIIAERKKESHQNNSAKESRKIPPSNTFKVDNKIEPPNMSQKVDGSRKPEKHDPLKEPSTPVHKDTPFRHKDASSPRTGPLPDIYQDANESLFDPLDAFVIKELTEELSNMSPMDEYQQILQDSDAKIRQWSRGKEGNIRSLLSTLQHVLWPGSGWKPVALMDIIEANQVKRTYQRALLCLHPDKLQQKGAAEHQKYIAEKVFDILQESWNHFNALTSL